MEKSWKKVGFKPMLKYPRTSKRRIGKVLTLKWKSTLRNNLSKERVILSQRLRNPFLQLNRSLKGLWSAITFTVSWRTRPPVCLALGHASTVQTSISIFDETSISVTNTGSTVRLEIRIRMSFLAQAYNAAFVNCSKTHKISLKALSISLIRNLLSRRELIML